MNHLILKLRRSSVPKDFRTSPRIYDPRRPFLGTKLPIFKCSSSRIGANAFTNRQTRFLTSGVEPRNPTLPPPPSPPSSPPHPPNPALLTRITRLFPSFRNSSESSVPTASNFRKIIALAKPERKPLAIAIILVRSICLYPSLCLMPPWNQRQYSYLSHRACQCQSPLQLESSLIISHPLTPYVDTWALLLAACRQ